MAWVDVFMWPNNLAGTFGRCGGMLMFPLTSYQESLASNTVDVDGHSPYLYILYTLSPKNIVSWIGPCFCEPSCTGWHLLNHRTICSNGTGLHPSISYCLKRGIHCVAKDHPPKKTIVQCSLGKGDLFCFSSFFLCLVFPLYPRNYHKNRFVYPFPFIHTHKIHPTSSYSSNFLWPLNLKKSRKIDPKDVKDCWMKTS